MSSRPGSFIDTHKIGKDINFQNMIKKEISYNICQRAWLVACGIGNLIRRWVLNFGESFTNLAL